VLLVRHLDAAAPCVLSLLGVREVCIFVYRGLLAHLQGRLRLVFGLVTHAERRLTRVCLICILAHPVGLSLVDVVEHAEVGFLTDRAPCG
jgi:hypothetical protein